MEIRRAVEGDIDHLVELIQKTGHTKEKAIARTRKIADDSRLVFVFGNSSRLLGYVGISESDNDKRMKKFVDLAHYAHLNWIGVDPDFVHHDIGSKLIQMCDEVARDWGKEGIWLDCRGKVIPFYLFNGYKIRGSYFHEEKARYVMIKKF